MKILHCCLSNYFADDRAYQENELVKEHVKAGHDVLILANTETYDANGNMVYIDSGEYMASEGAPIIRLPFHPWIPHKLAAKLRIHIGLYKLIEEFAPDVIMFHGICGWELLTVAKYKKHHEDVILFADNHADFINSAQSFASRWILHFLYYRPIVQRSLPYLDKVFYTTLFTKQFARDVHGVAEKEMEFLPLGGFPHEIEGFADKKQQVRKKLGLGESDIVFIQSGRQSKIKKLPELLRSFVRTENVHFKLFIAGAIRDDIREEVELLIAGDDRIRHLGWISPNDLEEWLIAADLYCQSGSQSSTMQTSLCCGCAILLEDMESHETYHQDNGWLVNGEEDIYSAFTDIDQGNINLDELGMKSLLLSHEMLDYKVLARRLTVLN